MTLHWGKNPSECVVLIDLCWCFSFYINYLSFQLNTFDISREREEEKKYSDIKKQI